MSDTKAAGIASAILYTTVGNAKLGSNCKASTSFALPDVTNKASQVAVSLPKALKMPAQQRLRSHDNTDRFVSHASRVSARVEELIAGELPDVINASSQASIDAETRHILGRLGMTGAMSCLHATFGSVTSVTLDHQPCLRIQLHTACSMRRIRSPVTNRLLLPQQMACVYQQTPARRRDRELRLPSPRAVKRSKEDAVVKPKQKVDAFETDTAGAMCIVSMQTTCLTDPAS